MKEQTIKIIEQAFEKAKKGNKLWRYNWVIGFRNGDVSGENWEDESLLDKSKEELVIREWMKENKLNYDCYEEQIKDLIKKVLDVRRGKK